MFAAFIIACATVTGVCKGYVPNARFDTMKQCQAAVKKIAQDADGTFATNPQLMALGVGVRKAGCVKVK